MLLQEMWVIPEMRTLNDCVRLCRDLRWKFPHLDIAVVFSNGRPRIEVHN